MERINQDPYDRVRTLIILRAVFITSFLGTAIIFHQSTGLFSTIPSILSLIILIYGLTLIYFIYLNFVKRILLFCYFQIFLDILIETIIIYYTGGINSNFAFLYIISIMTSNVILYGKGGYVFASLSSIFYGLLINFEYYKLIPFPLYFEYAENAPTGFAFYKLYINIFAFYSVAFLSRFLAKELVEKNKELQEKKVDFIKIQQKIAEVEDLAAIGQLATNIAHEIRNPLAAISGSMELLKEEFGSQEKTVPKLMEIILSEVERLNLIISHFLDYAYPKQANKKNCELNALIRDNLELIKKSKDFNPQIKINFSSLSKENWIKIDAEQIKQVIWNICLNALQALDMQGGELNIFIQNKNNSVLELEICFKDNGCGMDQTTLSKIFTPFYTTKEKGTGLGLAIVSKIIKEHQGKIEINSASGKGTEIIITLPKE